MDICENSGHIDENKDHDYSGMTSAHIILCYEYFLHLHSS